MNKNTLFISLGLMNRAEETLTNVEKLLSYLSSHYLCP